MPTSKHNIAVGEAIILDGSDVEGNKYLLHRIEEEEVEGEDRIDESQAMPRSVSQQVCLFKQIMPVGKMSSSSILEEFRKFLNEILKFTSSIRCQPEKWNYNF